MSELQKQTPLLFRFNDFEVDVAKAELRHAEKVVKITPKGFDLLVYLIRNRDRTIPKKELLTFVWQESSWTPSAGNKVDQALSDIRSILKADNPDAPTYIQTVHAVGIRFIAPVEELLPTFPTTRRLSTRRALLAGGLVALVCVLVFTYFMSHRPARTVSFPHVVPLTHSGYAKFTPIVTDGKQLFFTELENGHYWISTVSMDGGDTSLFPAQVPNPHVSAISPDRKTLLVRSIIGNDFSDPGPLFYLPTNGGLPLPLGVLAFDGTWTPDGREILYTRGSQIWRVDIKSKVASLFLTVDGQPWWLRFSPNGKKLRFTISDLKSQDLSLWETSSDGKGLHRVFPANSRWSKGGCGNWTADGAHFVFQGAGNLWWLDENTKTPVQLTQGPIVYRGPVPSPDGRKIFARSVISRGELLQFDLRSGHQTPLLPGIAAEMISFSPDQQSIVYLATYPLYSLVVSKTDGSGSRPLVQLPLQTAFPQWSPDGKNIVVSTRRSEEPWRISIINVSDLKREELTDTSFNSIHPTFSPDGQRIAFGNIPSTEGVGHPIQLYLVDLSTKIKQVVPGSQGLFSPVWSPNGQFIVALNGTSSHLMLYHVATETWTTLSTLKAGYPAWSRDNTAIYFTATQPDGLWFNRLDIETRSTKSLFRVHGEKLLTRWIGVHPSGALLAARDTSVQELYALEF